ncbi:unnamed protein product [Amoebophrya sp. A120]|nr:unnamed protein product [Amoebophrya sp. A120]|eukprot:GSA120T00004831001.1
MGPNGMGGGMDPNAMGGMDPNAMGGPPGGGPPDMANMDFDEMDPDEMMALEFDSTNVQSAGFKPPPGMENEVDGASFNMNAEGEMVMTTASGEEVIMDAPMGPSEAAIAVAPFASDGVANFFKFFNPTTSGRYPFGENEDPTTKYTIFVDAESRSVNDTTTGFVPKCKYGSEFWVKLGPGDRTGGAGWTAGTRTPHLGGNDFVKLVRVDGVDWSCISSYTDAVPEEVLALDIVMALEATSGAVPPVTTGSKVQVEVINKSGSTEIHEIIIGGNQGVKNYNQLRMVIEKKQEMVWDGLMGDMMEDMFMSDLGIDPMAMGADPMMAADPGMASAAMYGAAGADPSAKSTPKKAKSCFRGSVMAQVVKPKCFPTCARTGVTRAANTEEATAIAALKGDEIPFVLLKKRYNLKTLKEDSSFAASLPAAFKEGTCTARVGGLVDANGGAIFREKVSVPFKPPSCDFLTMNGTRTDLENMLTQMQSKVMEVNVNALARYEGTDTWSNCQALLNMGLKDAVETITVKSVGCPHTPPSCAGETEFEICTREANKNHPWCKDPCCNIDMQKTKCCAERDVQKNVKSSEVNPMAFGFSCPFGGADSIDGIEIAKATQRVLNNPQTCFGKESASKKAKLKALKDAAECCYAAVFGNDPSEEMFAAGGGSGDSKKKNSIQTCSSDLDCYSGTCIKVKSSSSGGGGGGAAAGGGSSGGGSGGSSGTDATPPKAFKHCFTTGSATNKGPFTTKGKSYTCALAPMATAGTALAQCLKDRFDKDAAGLATAWAIVSDLYGQGGDANADVSTIGAQLVSADTFQSCEGETGWMYNADDFFVREVLKTCSDESDCAAKCVSETKCNWAPMGTKLTNDECLNMFPSQTSFCKDPDGARWGQPSKTRPAVCQSSTVKILQSWDMWSYQQDKLQGVLRAMNVSDAECATIGDGTMRRTFTGMFDMDMTSFDMDDPMAMTAMPEMKPVYTCGHPNATTKIACLEECIGDSGFKPSASYRCEMPTNADGGCPTNWRVEQPPMEFDAMGMPIFSQPVCVPDDYGLTFSGANSPYTGFTDGVHTSGLYYPWDFTWFTDAQQGSTDRCAVLAAITGLETTVKRLMDDGSGFCFDDMCYFNATAAGIADYGACMNKVPSDQQSSYSTMFQQDWMNGNGACVIMRNDGWGDMMTSMTDFSTSPRKPADLNAFKTTCEGWGGSFYEGKRFEEPAVDTQELCSGHTECEIDMGYKVPGLTAEECAKNKRCLDSSGWPASCPGCEMDWSQYDAKDGACVKKVKQKSDCSTTTFYPSKSTALTGAGICYDATKMRGDCGSGWEYLECRESIPVASCKAATVASGTWAEPMTLLSQQLKCIPTVWGKCKDKADCEVGGMCTINTAALSNDAMMDPMMMMGMDPMAGMMGVPQEVWGPTEASKLTKKSTGSGGSGDQNQQQGMEDDPFMMMECIPHSKYMTPYFFDNVCKTDMSDVDVQDPMNPCGIDTSFTRVETDKCSGMVYDPFVFFDGNACYHYLTAQADCTGAGKSWVATGATQATCEGKKICMGGDGFDTGGRGKKECEKCNGLFDVANKWMANKFETSKLTNVTGEWTARAVEPVNKLITTMEKEPFMRKLGEVKRQLEAEEETQAMMCYFGRTATQLATIASICEQNRAPEYVPASTDSKNVYTTAAENKVGGEAEAQVAISAKTFNATTGGKRKQVGMETTTIKAEVPEISSAAASSSRRSLEELKEELRLLSAAGATTNDPGCYSVVKNANNKLVGQLTGDCFGMKTADGGTSMDGAAELCLNEKEEIKKSPSYTVPAFALRSGSAGAYTYSATAKTVKKNGPKLCASVTEANTYFCPAATVANAATQTADQGTAACPALKTQLDQVSQAATLVGGTAIPGTSAPATTSTAANTTSAAALPAGSVVASTAEFGINLPSSVQESQLMGLLGDSMKTGIAIAAGTAVEASQVTISELKFKVRRNLLEAAPMPQALAHPEDRDERRRLSTSAPKTLAVDYSIFIPATTAGASALVANLAAKMSTGTTASASFATALMSGFTSGLNAAGLSSQFTVTSVAVTGTATTTQTVASSSAYTTMLPSLALAFTSLLATFIFL